MSVAMDRKCAAWTAAEIVLLQLPLRKKYPIRNMSSFIGNGEKARQK